MRYSTVSIIIPVLNRAELIAETLNSIINQSYTNWECIIVDDGSTDHTLALLEEYSFKDSRIRFYSRPEEMIKGANSCRNLGFIESHGDYIIWFDSDDLMTQNHLEAKLRCIEENKVDFVVARTQNFQNGKLLQPYSYIKKEYGIKASDFILLKIHWYTYDVMLKREVAERIVWNEQMSSWQDYNYFCKMLLLTENGVHLDKILTHRRIHENSIQKDLTKNENSFRLGLLENRYLTFIDLEGKVSGHVLRELLYGMMNLSYEIKGSRKTSKYITKVKGLIKKYLGSTSLLYFQTAMLTSKYFGGGHFILERSKARKKYSLTIAYSKGK